MHTRPRNPIVLFGVGVERQLEGAPFVPPLLGLTRDPVSRA